MRVTFDIDPDNYEDRRQMKLYTQASNMRCFINELYEIFRRELKYNEELTSKERNCLERLRNEIIENLDDYGISFFGED